MGEISTIASSTSLTRAHGGHDMKSLLRTHWGRIQAVMPSHMSPERLYNLAVSAINQTPQLLEATPQSILACVMTCSALGLEPSAVDGMGNAYILPYRNKKTGRIEAQFILGYRGMITLARRSGGITRIYSKAVFNGERFEVHDGANGLEIEYSPDLTGNVPRTAENLAFVYMKAFDGSQLIGCDYMSRAEVERIRARSKARDFGPWKSDYVAMAEKTLIRRAARWLPMSVEARAAIAADETTPDYSNVFAPVVEVETAGGEQDEEPEAVAEGICETPVEDDVAPED